MRGKRNQGCRYGRALLAAVGLGWLAGVAAAQPANDSCSSAEVIAITSGASGALVGNSSGAAADAGLPGCTLTTFASTGAAGVWYSFVGTGNRVSFESCAQTTDFVMRVFCGDCTTPICAASDDDGCITNSLGPRLALCTTPGTQYYLLFAAYNTGTGGAYTINWSDGGTACPVSGRPQCGVAPSNDECVGAVPVSIGTTVTGTTIDATPESTIPATCGGVTLAVTDTAVWYSFVGNGSTVTVSTCSAVTGANHKIGIYTGACGSLVCSGGGGGTTPTCSHRDDAATATTVCTVVGQTYYIAVSNETNGSGLFELSLTGVVCVPPPVNDDCSGALPMTPGVNVTADTTQATNEVPAPGACSGLSTYNLGVWYTFTAATSNRHIVSTCNPGTTFNTRVYVYTGGCGAFTCVSANAVASPACGVRADAATVSFCPTAGTQYYVLVTNDTTGFGQVEVSLTDTGVDCSPPANDECAGALPIMPGINVTGDSTNATVDTGAGPTCNTFSTFNAGMWYTFTAATSNRFTASTCNAGTNYNTRVYVYTGGCGAFACVGANAVASPACGIRADAATVSFCAVAGTQYHILVTNDTTGTGTFELSLTDTGADCTPPVNDNCEGAVAIAVGQTVIGTNVNATNESPAPGTCNGLSTYNLGMWYTFTEGATARRLNITTCDANTNFNTRVYVYTGGCGAFTCVNANAVASPACGARADAASVTFCTTPGTQYYFLVTNDTTGTGVFGLALSDTGLGCAPPSNDLCTGATVIASMPYSDTPGADFATGDLDVACNAAANVETRNGVWYRFTTGPDAGDLVINETSANGTITAVFTGSDCGSLSEVGCTATETNGRIALQASTQYFILVGLNSNTAVVSIPYSISLNFQPIIGACCSGSGCTVVPQSQCSGTWQGAGTNCGGPTVFNFAANANSFEDISGTGTLLATVSACDDCGQTIAVGFNFNYLGTVYSSVWVCSNGFIQFGTTNSTVFTNAAIPATGAPNNIVAPLWDDLNTITGGDIYSRLDGPAGSQRLTISWQGVAQHLNSDANSFQVILLEGSNNIEFRYDAITPETPAGDYTIGYENSTGTEGGSIPASIIGGGSTARLLTHDDPCPAASTGACCSGANCSVTSSASCSGFGTSFSGAGTVCNVFGTNNTSPCCFADYNHVGGVTVQDIFDFLGGYFTGSPRADITGNGTSVQDIFDYLSLYFTGCN
jgi:Fe-S cluster assembly iron-binding protein IscA